ncbi:fimbrial biogenesis chaperone [Photorhabdus temperata]|uniref:fimbrial biogenesis chaperone n=1 Tax=Photorhabdus temperata TaxID=574560 RepID=UPI0003FC8497|nr:fimbria/pilus periplasmic chaperone [Photorhabdus temperata]
MKRLITAMIVTGLLGWPATSAQAEGVGINTTRIIYPADSHATTASVSNTSKEAVYLIQATVSSTSEGDKNAPFLVTPAPVSYGTRQPKSGAHHQNRPVAACRSGIPVLVYGEGHSVKL